MRVLIMGATSAIAEATARELAARGASIYLAGRSAERLQTIAADLKVRGAAATAVGVLSADDASGLDALTGQAASALGGLDGALIAHGVLSDQAACQRSTEALARDFEVNALSGMRLMTHLANHFESQGSGCIAVISSVAGDRGRASNYIYGSAKAALSAFASGLRQRLRASGVAVLTIKPGFVDTPMTAQFRKSAMWASPASVARPIAEAMIAKRSGTLYLPWFWYPIMALIRTMPEAVFKRLKL